MKRVCIFCGSSSGTDPGFAAAARETGLALVKRGLGLVYGGGNVGLMGRLADTVLAAGGEVIGVIPESLVQRELAHHGCTRLHIVGSMHERKAMMADLADAFVALPGGFGTLDEFCEILTWAQLGFHGKPCGLLNTAGFWDAFLAQLQHAVAEGFVRRAHADSFAVEGVPELLLQRLQSMKPEEARKVMDYDPR